MLLNYICKCLYVSVFLDKDVYEVLPGRFPCNTAVSPSVLPVVLSWFLSKNGNKVWHTFTGTCSRTEEPLNIK